MCICLLKIKNVECVILASSSHREETCSLSASNHHSILKKYNIKFVILKFRCEYRRKLFNFLIGNIYMAAEIFDIERQYFSCRDSKRHELVDRLLSHPIYCGYMLAFSHPQVSPLRI